VTARGRRAGFSLVETLLATVVLAVALAGALGSITSSALLGESTRGITQAYLAAHEKLEELKALPARDVFALFNDDPSDDPDGPGTAPGPGFAVAGLDPAPGDADGLAGEVRLPADPAEASLLIESNDLPEFGLPRDLDADGATDDEDHAGDYVLLPVRVRIEWGGPGGRRNLTLETVLCAP